MEHIDQNVSKELARLQESQPLESSIALIFVGLALLLESFGQL